MPPAVAERANLSAAPVHEASREEARAILDRQARRYLQISGEEFIRRWKAGYWPHPDQVPGVMRVSMLLPFAE